LYPVAERFCFFPNKAVTSDGAKNPIIKHFIIILEVIIFLNGAVLLKPGLKETLIFSKGSNFHKNEELFCSACRSSIFLLFRTILDRQRHSTGSIQEPIILLVTRVSQSRNLWAVILIVALIINDKLLFFSFAKE